MQTHYPIIVQQDEDGFFVAECPLFVGCYTQGKTYEAALRNIKEVIQLCQAEHKTLPKFSQLSITSIAI